MCSPFTHVLAVDDERDYAGLIKTILERDGEVRFEVECAHTLKDGLRTLRAGGIDVLILDLHLPDSEGVKTVAQVREVDQAVPILILSARDDDGTIFQALAGGAQDYLVKTPAIHNLLPRSLLYAMERKKVERQLRDSEERYRLLVESSIEGIGVSRGNELVFANPALMEIFGYDSLEDIRQKSLLDLVAPTSRPLAAERIRLRAQGATPPPEVEIEAVRKDGTVRHLEMYTTEIPLNGEPHVLATFRDVTAVKRAYDILDSSPVVAFIWKNQAEFPVEFVTKNVEHLLGYTAEEFLSGAVSWPGITHPDDDARLRAELQRLEERGIDNFSQEYRLIAKDGRTVWIKDHTGALRDAHGNISHYQAIIIDCTERKVVEEEVQAFSRKLLSAREEEKRNFSNILHHETGSYAVGLTARLSAVEDAIARGQGPAATESLRQARTLVNEFVARLKGLASDQRPPDLDILGLPAALNQLCKQAASDTDIDIRFSGDVPPSNIATEHATAMFRTAQEALTNAVKHADAQSVKVDLHRTAHELVLTVEDDGRGFGPVKADAPQGGLGIRAMREMLASQGGRLTVDSRPGKGTLVRAVVPDKGALAQPAG